MDLPKDVSFILNKLRDNGYLSYVVGGAVRDYLLGKNPTDYDITTNALPSEIKRIFSNYYQIDTGMKHGTIMVVIHKNMYEITTFRKETQYCDHRHPSQVTFIDNLYEDLSRRDFTINAMAFFDKVYDYFGGQDDINSKIIRTVNNPFERFDEDALRILRAIRFSCKLDYEIEEVTKKAILYKKNDLNFVSKERIYQEFIKIMMGNTKRILPFYEVFKVIIPTIEENHFIENVSLINEATTLEVKISIFLKDNSDYLNILKDFKFSNLMIKEISTIIESKDIAIINDEYFIKKLLNKYGSRYIKKIIEFHKILYGTLISDDLLSKALNSCYTIKDMDIDGFDLISLKIQPKNRSRLLNEILEEILKNNLENNKESIFEYIKKKTQ